MCEYTKKKCKKKTEKITIYNLTKGGRRFMRLVEWLWTMD